MNYKDTKHWMHAVLTLCTGGVWAIIWMWRHLSNESFNRKLHRDRMERK